MKKNKNITIVVAEDSQTQAEQLRFLLEGEGYTIFCGRNGLEALKLIKHHIPTLIISDILMPELDGYQLCSKIKKDNRLKHIPVVLLTLLSHPADIIKGLECGAENFITKPFENEFLLLSLQRIILNIELRQEPHAESGLDVHFNGKNYRIDANQGQILDLLLSSIENSIRENKKLIQTNEQLKKTREKLKHLNQNLEKEVEKRTEKIIRLNSLLKAIRNINQLIVREKDPGRLLQTACEQLVWIRDYHHAVCLYMHQSGKIKLMGQSGLGDDAARLSDYMEKGLLPACCKKVLEKENVVIIKDHSANCGDCPLISKEKEYKSISVPLKYNRRIYGILIIHSIQRISSMREESGLLNEAAGDLAFALYDIELKAEHDKANRDLAKRTYDLNERVKELNCLHGLDEVMTLPGVSISEVFHETLLLIRHAWQFPDITACRIEYEGQAFQSENFTETEWSLKTDLIIQGKKKGFLEVCYTEIPGYSGDPFLEEEIYLQQNIAGNLEKFIQGKIAEDKLKEQYKLLNQLINSSPDLITVKDQEGRYILNNTAFIQFKGLQDPEKVTGKTDFDLFPGERAERYEEEDSRVIKTGEPEFNLEEMIPDTDGNERWFLTLKIPLTDESGNATGLISISRDITELKRNSMELLQAKEEAVKANSLKTAFLMNMSHEIRTPMNAIIGFSDLLSKSDITDPDRNTFLRIIIENSQQLLRLIDDILDISKIESGLVEIAPKIFSMRDMISELVEYFKNQRNLVGKKDLDIRIQEECINVDHKLSTDPGRLRQIISNLMENALKFTESGTIEIGYEITSFKSPDDEKSGAGEQSYLRFSVKDTGIGIKKENYSFIFDRFSKVEDKIKLYSGVGLGLTISGNLVHLLGGEIWVESEVDKGSCFYFTIPYEQTHKERETVKKSEMTEMRYDWKNKLILIAEDEESNYSLLKYGLEKTGATLLWAKNGKEAAEMCQSDSSIDLVLMDIKMPGMDGLEATRMIRINRQDLPIIAVTAYATNDDMKQCKEAGCDEFISKPVNFEDLFVKINSCFDKS